MKSLLAGLVIGMALAPSAPQAADVERVQRACATLQKGAPPSTNDAVQVLARAAKALPQMKTGITVADGAAQLVDARVYELFCK